MRQWGMADAARSGSQPRQQCADAVLMVRPAAFGYNPETAGSNAFQKPAQGTPGPEVQAAARAEFDCLVRALVSEGVSVCVAEDTPDPPKPDAVFVNNWVSFHEDGTLVLYPLEAPSRRRERRQEIIDQAVQELGFKLRHLIDLMHHEAEARFLEGTRSLVLDHS